MRQFILIRVHFSSKNSELAYCWQRESWRHRVTCYTKMYLTSGIYRIAYLVFATARTRSTIEYLLWLFNPFHIPRAENMFYIVYNNMGHCNFQIAHPINVFLIQGKYRCSLPTCKYKVIFI